MIAGMSSHTRYLHAAIGFLELGMPDDAWEEVDSLPAGQRDLAEVRELRITIAMRLGRWQAARADAETMARRDPGNPSWWISWAYALRRESSIQEAREILLRATELHPRELMISYNLACYASVLGELDEARGLLERVVSEDSGFRELAMNDPDLIPIFIKEETDQ
jgi:Flp pilus assembly protein TadD